VRKRPPVSLTAKQHSVLKELVAGRSNREIATRMNISTDTVSSHLKEIFNRLSARNRTEAVVRYLALSSHDASHQGGPD
jgi:DNA-binding NarL/FixJ family response regulator